ncbi:preprotein translocase subunit YajC [Rhodococcoides corynebacterioides]|uniref:preprotein translocase subunit YajC n=1 Tax=Rhodococcoides corynebacterioides TaxID=53972 RepID=UPI001C9A355E|nr:preprotein translocase subunit YajC [Rhodococcus corynebacterioides]MBY6362017.1 preprotein translocase subunit YajC [Rhodococcus corynebacterioides]
MELLFPLLILALLVPMFMGIRRQKKEMAKVSELQQSLSVGDRVITTAGLHGLVDDLTEDTVDLEIAPGIITTWSRVVVREVVADQDETDELDETTATDYDETVDAGARVDALENGRTVDTDAAAPRLTKD